MTQRQIAWARSRRAQDHELEEADRAQARATARATVKREIDRATARKLRTWVPDPSERTRP